MNGAQQRQHRRATDTLAQVITETQGAVVERFEEMEASVAALADRLQETRTCLNSARQCCDERWVHTGFAQQRLFLWQTHHDALTFWGRLRWLVTGR